MMIPIMDMLVIEKDIVVPMTALAGFVAGVVLGRLVPVTVKSVRPKKVKTRAGKGGAEVYVGNLPYSMSENDLRKTFGKHGAVLGVRIITNRNSGSSKGYGFVTMSTGPEAKSAIKELNSTEIGGRRIVVSSARTAAR